jgi:hypothetical protein
MSTDIIPALDPEQPGITLLTALAEASDLSDAEYRAIYDRLADEKRSLRNIATALRSGVSHGWWAKYANGEAALDQARKAELRRWAGLPELPPTVAEAVADAVHPDAAVYRIGERIASRVLLIGADVPAVALRVNGAPAVLAQTGHVTGVTAITSVANHETVHGCPVRQNRRKYVRPCLSPDPVRRLAQLAELTAQAQREIAEAAPVYLPGDRLLYAGQPARVICGHADGQRLYIRVHGSGDDLLVPVAACTPADAEAGPAAPPAGD